MEYRTEAVKCVNNYVLPEMKRQFEECGCSLDEQYKKYGDTEYFFANIIQPGHIYEIGYPRCVCQKAQEEKDADANFCECSRQSILYVYEQLIPDRKVSVETIETALRGGDKCRFRVTVK
jgi:hypothetical protein